MKDNNPMEFVQDFLILNGFENKSPSKKVFVKDVFIKGLVTINIHNDYEIKFIQDKENYTWYSKDLGFYSLLGFLLWHEFIPKDFKRPENILNDVNSNNSLTK